MKEARKMRAFSFGTIWSRPTAGKGHLTLTFIERCLGGTYIHNHTNNNNMSSADMLTAIIIQVKQLKTLVDNGTYIFEPYDTNMSYDTTLQICNKIDRTSAVLKRVSEIESSKGNVINIHSIMFELIQKICYNCAESVGSYEFIPI